MRAWTFADDVGRDDLDALLPEAATLGPGGSGQVRVRVLDTFDWRLHRAGWRLWWELDGSDGRLRLTTLDGELAAACPAARPPEWRTDLPDGHIADTVGHLLTPRRLLPLGAAAVDRLAAPIHDTEGNLLLRAALERWFPLSSNGEKLDPLPWTLRCSGPVPKHPTVDRVVAAFDAAASRHAIDHAVAICRASGRVPGDYSSKISLDLAPDTPAGKAARTILAHLLDTIEANVDGTVRDLDVEFLHDLRVATRRSRSAVSQLKKALDMERVAPYAAELKWLGSVTGPCRDLDVWLLEMPTMRSRLPADAAEALDPFEAHLARRRDAARRSVARALGSARFEDLVSGWRAVIETDGTGRSGPASAVPIRTLARRRILKVFGRIVAEGRALGPDPPAGPLHALRIEAKKLRYLLEFFSGIGSRPQMANLVKRLKTIQDVLGGFNDMEVQQARLREFSAELLERSAPAAETLLALGRLDGIMAVRQEEHRLDWHRRFQAFDTHEIHQAFHSIFEETS